MIAADPATVQGLLPGLFGLPDFCFEGGTPADWGPPGPNRGNCLTESSLVFDTIQVVDALRVKEGGRDGEMRAVCKSLVTIA